MPTRGFVSFAFDSVAYFTILPGNGRRFHFYSYLCAAIKICRV